ncbi:hypothetical protein BCR33DRAFT_718992 [Rhizoclosmatium globosum]|uniref:C2H2-type domain-containing protein n=1 Tax=Rhizoclosmatium globosum TaxID=329046 RepID=A0A1Y2C3B5_9FUNG|nr:hypothetical protein BCR33DRAFT_718992 [Rhizoclosmatium globosum]|eukprot:ORY41387.1 hypothetical protein BCR33DRAFT_718992 [Rhizoclosmatium globosum]
MTYTTFSSPLCLPEASGVLVRGFSELDALIKQCSQADESQTRVNANANANANAGTKEESPFMGALALESGRLLFEDDESSATESLSAIASTVFSNDSDDFLLFDKLTSESEPSESREPTRSLFGLVSPVSPVSPPLSTISTCSRSPVPAKSISPDDLSNLTQLPIDQSNQNVTISMADLQALLHLAAGNISHQQPQLPQKERKMHTCPVDGCGKQFSRAFNMKTHMQIHAETRDRPFVCPRKGCQKSFIRVHDLNRHAVSHDKSKWFYCKGCSRGYARIDALKRHETTGCSGRD